MACRPSPLCWRRLGIFYAVATHLMYVFKCIQAVVAEYVKSTCIQYVFSMYSVCMSMYCVQYRRHLMYSRCSQTVFKVYFLQYNSIKYILSVFIVYLACIYTNSQNIVEYICKYSLIFCIVDRSEEYTYIKCVF